MNVELFICHRYFAQKNANSITPLINVLAVLGITIGVTVLIIVTATINGFKVELERRILNIDPHIIVSEHNYCTINNQYDSLDDLDKIGGITSTYIVIYSQGLLRGISGVSGTIIKGVDLVNYTPLRAILTSNHNNNLLNSSIKLPTEGGPMPIVLGIDLAKQLGVENKGVVYLISPIGNNSSPSFVPFIVVAIFKTGIKQYDSTLAYIDISNPQFLSSPNRLASSIEIRVDDAHSSTKIAKIVKNKIGPKFLVRDWTQINSNLFSTLKTQKCIMFIALFFVVLVAAMSVSSALIMAVMNKVNDIIILKSMGVRNFSIGKIFVIRGVIIGLLGTALGIISGLFICHLLNRYEFINLPGDIYILNKLPAIIDWQETSIISLTTIIICFLSSIFPAYKASSVSHNRISI